jgi:hypothetical protein
MEQLEHRVDREERRAHAVVEERPVTAPLPLRRLVAEPRANRVAVHVADGFEEVRLPDDRNGVEPTLEDVPARPVAAVESLCEDAAEIPHRIRDSRLRRLEHEVEVVRHHAEGVAHEPVAPHGLVEWQQEIHVVVLAAEDPPTVVPTGSHMAEAVDQIASWLARHASTLDDEFAPSHSWATIVADS